MNDTVPDQPAPAPDPQPVPLHRWAHKGGRVLLVKCVAKGGAGHGDFAWPKAGKVICPKAAQDRQTAALVTGQERTDCASGGLFGWPWGVNLGGGKTPDYRGDWIVFASAPDDVVDLGDKAKSVGEVEVLYYGDALGALIYTLEGRIAWVEQNSRGSAAATGYSGSAAATGESGSAAATGSRGSAAATGSRGSAAATGERCIAALTGEYGEIEVGPGSLGAVTARNWYWRVRAGAVVACQWQDAGGRWHSRLLSAEALGLTDGKVQVFDGEIRE